MPKLYYVVITVVFAMAFLFLMDKSAYVKELDSRELSQYTLPMPEDGPSGRNTGLAAGKINGVVVGPGETFSFNDVVGPRTVERGFEEGLSIIQVNGQYQYVRDVGGGICRTSTALHQAVLGAGLEVKERHDHLIPVEYAEKGQDAALLYGRQDYRFRNTRENPVKIVATTGDGRLVVKLEEKVLEKIDRHILFRPGTLEYYLDRLKSALKVKI